MCSRALVRPSWSLAAYRRKIQTSPYALHILVEGKQYDGGYYGRIAEASAIVASGGYEVTRVDTIYTAGGKAGVIGVFESLRRSGNLVQHTSRGKRVAVFMLDSDVRTVVAEGAKRNPHVFYTSGYDIESDILVNGDGVAALSAAVGISPRSARALASALGAWYEDAATHWKEWIILCCLAKRLRVGCDASFSRAAVKPSDLANIPVVRSNLQARAGLSSSEFASLERTIRRRVESALKRRSGYTLVKGKWLPAYLEARISSHYSKSSCPDLNNFKIKIVSCYLATLNGSESWALRYRSSWEYLVT
ncbi:hypothetical protein NONI108955_36100 [Nocardia ninae]|uniref:hypothetical protein n=1 Tax=Nocardia ninae TaxID=356145 RepID=UPI0011BF69BB|nr:hypothetical protein [Nocardia ninae]